MDNNVYVVDINKYQKLDIYRILTLYEVKNPCLQHAIKKLLCAGKRGAKNTTQDIKEAIISLQRYLEMQEEDGSK